jgi:hypothetical protein
MDDLVQDRPYRVLGIDRNAGLTTFNMLLRASARGNREFHKEDALLANRERGGSFAPWIQKTLDNFVARAAGLSEEWRAGFLDKAMDLSGVASDLPVDGPRSFSILGKNTAAVIKGNSNEPWVLKPLHMLDYDDLVAIAGSKLKAGSKKHVTWMPVAAIMGPIAVHKTRYPQPELDVVITTRIAAAPLPDREFNPAAKIFGEPLDSELRSRAHRPEFVADIAAVVAKHEKSLK